MQKVVKDTGRVLQTGSQQRTEYRRHVPPGGRAGPRRPPRQGQDDRVPHRRQPDERPDPGVDPSPRGWTGTSGSARPPKVPYRKKGEQDELPLRVPLVVRVLRRQDDRLGRPPPRHRPVGPGQGRQRPVAVEVLKAAEPYKGGDGYNCHPSFQVQYTYDNGTKVIAMSGGGTDAGAKLVDKDGKVPEQRSAERGSPCASARTRTACCSWARRARSSSAAARSSPATPRSCRSRSRTTRRSTTAGRPTTCRTSSTASRAASRRSATPTVGGGSVIVCHIGVIALRTGKKLKWDP